MCSCVDDPTALLVLQVRGDKRYRLAVGSFKEDTNNQVEIIQREQDTLSQARTC
jgi:hypothetical protein